MSIVPRPAGHSSAVEQNNTATTGETDFDVMVGRCALNKMNVPLLLFLTNRSDFQAYSSIILEYETCWAESVKSGGLSRSSLFGTQAVSQNLGPKSGNQSDCTPAAGRAGRIPVNMQIVAMYTSQRRPVPLAHAAAADGRSRAVERE